MEMTQALHVFKNTRAMGEANPNSGTGPHAPEPFRRRVLVSNERVLRPACETIGTLERCDALVGIATTTLWNLAGQLRPGSLVAFDRSLSAVMQARLYLALLGLCADGERFRDRLLGHPATGAYSALGLERAHAGVCERLGELTGTGPSESERLMLFELHWRHAFVGAQLTYSGVTLGDQLAEPTHFTNDRGAYAHLKERAEARAILIYQADATNDASAAPVAEWLVSRQEKLAAFYLSNVPDYVFPSLAWRSLPSRTNASALVSTGRSVGSLSSELSLQTEPLLAFFGRAGPRPERGAREYHTRGLPDFGANADTLRFLDRASQREFLLIAAESDRALHTWCQPYLAALETPRQWLAFAARVLDADLRTQALDAAQDAAIDDASLADWIVLLPALSAEVRRAVVGFSLAHADDVTTSCAHADATHMPLLAHHAPTSLAACNALLRLGESPDRHPALANALRSGASLDFAGAAHALTSPDLLAAVLDQLGIDPKNAWPETLLDLAQRQRLALLDHLKQPGVRHFVERLGAEPNSAWARALLSYTTSDRELALADAQALAVMLGLYD